MSSTPDPGAAYRLILTPKATHALANRIPAKAALAIYALTTGPLLQNPHRLGKALTVPFEGLFSARTGSYRVIYTIDQADKLVKIVAIGHRADVYRP
ncbi:MAG: type II toxin-antitoxin system RelE/ParE family toxin [Propionibacteriaceae bacterium]|nr:type II toxin-antitoxin system RelE/ParE family toxin [Propionibacteriaceae bacterium]